MPDPTPADRLALALCRAGGYPGPCHVSEICNGCREEAAAVIRELAEQVVPNQKPWHRTSDASDAKHAVRLDILAIATELEGANG